MEGRYFLRKLGTYDYYPKHYTHKKHTISNNGGALVTSYRVWDALNNCYLTQCDFEPSIVAYL